MTRSMMNDYVRAPRFQHSRNNTNGGNEMQARPLSFGFCNFTIANIQAAIREKLTLDGQSRNDGILKYTHVVRFFVEI